MNKLRYLLLICVAVPLAAASKPNVLLICVDDLKPLLGAYSNRTVKSPNIDRLAQRGLIFDRAYCNQAVCAPSRNALMTGLRPTTLGIYDLGTFFRKSASNTVTMSQQFMRHGYRAEGLGKVLHVGHGNHDDPASWSVPHFGTEVVAYARKAKETNELTREEALFSNVPGPAARRLRRGPAYESLEVADDAYPDARLATEAIRRLQKAKTQPEIPFFMAVGFVKPHLPFCAPKKYWDLYEPGQFKLSETRTLPDGAPNFAGHDSGELRQYEGIPPQGPLDEDLQRTLIHGYHAALSYMDAQLGRLLDEMDRLELTRNTIIILWGDHGWHLGDHGMWCKHSNFEQATRIPLIVAAPGVTKPGSRTEALAETVDLYPTLLDLAGLPQPVPAPHKLDGQSLVPVLRDPASKGKTAIYHVYPRSPRDKGAILGRAVRTARHRLVEWKAPGAAASSATYELYDYQNDPEETRNQAAEQPEILQVMKGLLDVTPEAVKQISR